MYFWYEWTETEKFGIFLDLIAFSHVLHFQGILYILLFPTRLRFQDLKNFFSVNFFFFLSIFLELHILVPIRLYRNSVFVNI